MKKKAIITATVLATLLTSCSNGRTADTPLEKEIPVKVMEVTASDATNYQNYVGTIEEVFSSTLSFEVSGNVSKIYIREGQQVTKGQLIATLDPTTYLNNHEAAISTLQQAEDAYNRMKVLFDNNSLPEIKWVETQTSVQQARSAEAIANKNLNDCLLYAPFSGIISERSIETGTNVMPGMPAFRLVTIDKVKIKIAVPEKEISNIRIGQTADITVAALDDKQLTAQVTEKNVTANPLSHTYEVKIMLENNAADLMPGMVCKVNINPGNDNQREIIVPAHVVQVSHTGENFVWVANESRATKRTVNTNGFTNDGVIISGGLQNGEHIIVEGNQKVSEGMKISIR